MDDEDKKLLRENNIILKQILANMNANNHIRILTEGDLKSFILNVVADAMFAGK